MIAKALQCGDVYREHDMKRIEIKRLDKSLRQRMRCDRASQKSASLHDLPFHATSLFILQGGWEGSLQTEFSTKSHNQRRGWQNRGQPVNDNTSSDEWLNLIW